MTGHTTGALVLSSAGPTRADLDELCGRLAARGVRIVRAGPEPERGARLAGRCPRAAHPDRGGGARPAGGLEMAIGSAATPTGRRALSKVTIT